MKDKYSITKRWEAKIQEMYKKADFKYAVLMKNAEKKAQKNLAYDIEKIERKKRSYIRKKEEEYRRKMLNEIREFEWKPKREYKTDAPKIKPLQFAMELAQEVSRLRDSDPDWNGYCISCDWLCSWANHAWGHRYPRTIKGVCLAKENINLQCNNCNWITWPKGNAAEKEKVNHHYDENLDIKYWPKTAEKLRKKVAAYFQGTLKYELDLDLEIPKLIEEDEALWKTKNFYAPRRKWRAIWIKYKNRT